MTPYTDTDDDTDDGTDDNFIMSKLYALKTWHWFDGSEEPPR